MRVVGESMQPDGMLALMKWEEETPYVYFFKHGLDEEKVVSTGKSYSCILLFFLSFSAMLCDECQEYFDLEIS